MLSTIEILSLFIMIFNLIVVFQSAINYWKFRIIDFAIFGLAFTFGFYFGFGSVILNRLVPQLMVVTPAIPHQFLYYDSFWYRLSAFLFGITVNGTIYFLSIYFSRAIWRKPPLSVTILVNILFLVQILVYLPILIGTSFNLGLSLEQASIIRAWSFFLPIFVYGVLNIKMIKELGNIPFELENEIKPAKRIWNITFYSTLIYTLVNIVFVFVVTVHGGRPNLSAYDIPLLLVRGTAAITFLFAAFIAWKYPAGLLIFDAYIVRLKPIYEHIIREGKRGHPDSELGTDQVENYIFYVKNYLDSKTTL